MNGPSDQSYMARALELAAQGLGRVEPNPMVGCVLVADGRIVGEGWHERFGGPHAEVLALQDAGNAARNSTAYVTLEPCSHMGKTPPCADALIAAGVQRVVAAQVDPYPEVAGQGLQRLRDAGIAVDVGLLSEAAADLNAPYLKLVRQSRPWVIAKWAMSLDGKIATADGESRWISGPESRALVHTLRGRVDGIMVGKHTALVDDPLLTARPAGPRVATRVVLDSLAELPTASQLVRSAREVPVLIAVSQDAPVERQNALQQAGCEVLVLAGGDPDERLQGLLDQLGRRLWTNLLVEGGARLLGSLFAVRAVDEVHVFVAPQVIGGADAPGAVAGPGLGALAASERIESLNVAPSGKDLHVWGRVHR